MAQKSLWQVAVITSLEAEEAVVELLGRLFSQPAAIYTNERTRITTVSIYCRQRRDWTSSKHAELRAGLKIIRAAGLNTGAAKIVAREVAREDWSESWKRHFKLIEIGSKLLVKPGWIKQRPKKNQAVVVLNPGLSFGTGNHPTTAFCLHQLAACRDSKRAQSFWDIGTGSGILAIAAIKLGYAPVRAMDFDPESVRVAQQNARENRVEKKIQLRRQDITKLSLASREKYDFICANLISNLLIAQRRRIANRLGAGGRLVLAGILRNEFPEVQKAYEELGLKLVKCRIGNEWRSGSFMFS